MTAVVRVPIPLGDQPIRIRSLSDARWCIPDDALPPDAAIRGIELWDGTAYVVAATPEQLRLF